jgi:hypothetical protein
MPDQPKIDPEELDTQEPELLPDREAMTTIAPEKLTGPLIPLGPEPIDP